MRLLTRDAGHDRMLLPHQGRRVSKAVFGSLLLLATACGGTSGVPTTSTKSEAADISNPPEAADPVDIITAFEEQIASPSFAASFTGTVNITLPGMVNVESEVSATVSGPDSYWRQEDDYSGLEEARLSFYPGSDYALVVGPGGVSTRVDESTFVAGELLQSRGDGLWVRDPEGNDTPVGYMIDRLRAVEVWEEAGVETVGDVELRLLQAPRIPEFDPQYFGLGARSLFTTFVAVPEVLVDASGALRTIRLRLAYEHETWGMSVIDYTLETAGSTAAVEVTRPDAWGFVSDRGLKLTVFDLMVPESWEVEENEDSYFAFSTPEGDYLLMEVTLAESPDPEDAMSLWADAWDGTLVESAPLADARWPAASGSVRLPDGATGSAYILTFAGLNVAAMWVAQGASDDNEFFERLMSRFHFVPDRAQNLVPGPSLADMAQQAELLEVIPAISVSPECSDPSVAYAEFVSASHDGWAENWYVACEQLLRVRIDFVPDGEGVAFVIGPLETVGGSG